MGLRSGLPLCFSALCSAGMASQQALPAPGDTLHQVEILLPDTVGVTWFSPIPGEPLRAVASIHTEWNSHVIHILHATASGWVLGRVAPFSGRATDRAARFDPMGRLLFSSRRSGGAGDWDLWIVERTRGEWREPQLLGGDDIMISFREESRWSDPLFLPPPVNTASYEYGAHLSANGDRLLFTSSRSGAERIYEVPVSLLHQRLQH